MGVRVKVGFKDSVGVQIGQNFPQGTFGVHGASVALGAHGRLGATPLATNCWPKAPRGGGGGRGSWRPRTRGVAPPREAEIQFFHRMSQIACKKDAAVQLELDTCVFLRPLNLDSRLDCEKLLAAPRALAIKHLITESRAQHTANLVTEIRYAKGKRGHSTLI